ncbi:Eco57I restriction-modification methylase domain-containing protein [Humibacter soli]
MTDAPATKAPFALRGHNPDVLTCIANLSNDEVFTPPELANQMLDTLEFAWAESNGGTDIWADPTVTFLDPFTKSGVFLREIVSRLSRGLETAIPDLATRVDHILTKQVHGIGITRLTAMLARRSVYCSKDARGPHSVATSFDRDWGNIWFERTDHVWAGDRCAYCGAAKAAYDRADDLETHAYAFIHTTDIKARLARMFGADMQFDVIIGNPPYQLSTGSSGGAGVQAKPLYNLFVEQAKKLEPRYIVNVTPSRWFSGGMGLDTYRQSMLKDARLRVIEDFPDSNEVFPGTQIKGGISYWLWDRDSPGPVRVTTHDKGEKVSTATRRLVEPGTDVFVRYNQGVSILRKVAEVEFADDTDTLTLPHAKQFVRLVSPIGAFGLDSTFRGSSSPTGSGDLKVYRNGGIGYLPRASQTKELHVVDLWKVFVPRAGSGSDAFPHSILGRPFLGEPGSISSWTYMYIGPFETSDVARNVMSYIRTRFFRFLVLLHKATQDATPRVYTFVPTQDFSRAWTDADLYAKYGISDEEIAFIESMVRPMDDDTV